MHWFLDAHSPHVSDLSAQLLELKLSRKDMSPIISGFQVSQRPHVFGQNVLVNDEVSHLYCNRLHRSLNSISPHFNFAVNLSFSRIFHLWIGVNSADVWIAIFTTRVVHHSLCRWQPSHGNATFCASGIVWLPIVPKQERRCPVDIHECIRMAYSLNTKPSQGRRVSPSIDQVLIELGSRSEKCEMSALFSTSQFRLKSVFRFHNFSKLDLRDSEISDLIFAEFIRTSIVSGQGPLIRLRTCKAISIFAVDVQCFYPFVRISVEELIHNDFVPDSGRAGKDIGRVEGVLPNLVALICQKL